MNRGESGPREADDARSEQRARESMLSLAGSIGGNRDVRFLRHVVDGAGADPVAVRAAVLTRDGHPMTPLPDGVAGEAVLERVPGATAMLRCPVWTTAGRSHWEMTLASEERRGFFKSHVTRLVHLEDGTVLDATSAPCPARNGEGWADDADYLPEVWPAPAGDPRIPRGAFVGSSYGVLFQQLLAGVHETLPYPYDLRLLNPGQAAITLLDFSYTAIYGDGLPTAYERMWQPNFESDIVDACEHIGAHAFADVFRRIGELLPVEARGSWEARRDYVWTLEDDEDGARWTALDRELSALEDAGDLIWVHMLNYVNTHPEEFFLPEVPET